MRPPSLPSPQERGKRWLQAKVQPLLADSAVPMAPLSAAGDPACAWGTGPETETTRYLRLAGELEPKALRFRRTMIMDCGTGRYFAQHQAMIWMRRTLKNIGILPA
jgi:hypothetical protein